MSTNQILVKQMSEEVDMVKRTYYHPMLRVYGHISQLTGGTGGTLSEGQSGMANKVNTGSFPNG
jgi:hypothetical protein